MIRAVRSPTLQFALVAWTALAVLMALALRAAKLQRSSATESSRKLARVSSSSARQLAFQVFYIAGAGLLLLGIAVQSLATTYLSGACLILAWATLTFVRWDARIVCWGLIVATVAIGLPESWVRWPVDQAAAYCVGVMDSLALPTYLAARSLQTSANVFELAVLDGPVNLSMLVCVAVTLSFHRRRSLAHGILLTASAYLTIVLASTLVLLASYAVGTSFRLEAIGAAKFVLLQSTYLALSVVSLVALDRFLTSSLEAVPQADPRYGSVYNVLNIVLSWPNKLDDTWLMATSPEQTQATSRPFPAFFPLRGHLPSRQRRERLLLPMGLCIFIAAGTASVFTTVRSISHDASADQLLAEWASRIRSDNPADIRSDVRAAVNELPRSKPMASPTIIASECRRDDAGVSVLQLATGWPNVLQNDEQIQVYHEVSYQPARPWVVPTASSAGLAPVHSKNLVSEFLAEPVEVTVVVDSLHAKSYRIVKRFEREVHGRQIQFTLTSTWPSGRSLDETEQLALANASLTVERTLTTLDLAPSNQSQLLAQR